VVVLQEGRIVEDSSPAKLRRRRGFFDRMCRLQEGEPARLAG
jgi:ABC-type multidrug transport system fused ATPase/permease subunit